MCAYIVSRIENASLITPFLICLRTLSLTSFARSHAKIVLAWMEVIPSLSRKVVNVEKLRYIMEYPVGMCYTGHHRSVTTISHPEQSSLVGIRRDGLREWALRSRGCVFGMSHYH